MQEDTQPAGEIPPSQDREAEKRPGQQRRDQQDLPPSIRTEPPPANSQTQRPQGRDGVQDQARQVGHQQQNHSRRQTGGPAEEDPRQAHASHAVHCQRVDSRENQRQIGQPDAQPPHSQEQTSRPPLPQQDSQGGKGQNQAVQRPPVSAQLGEIHEIEAQKHPKSQGVGEKIGHNQQARGGAQDKTVHRQTQQHKKPRQPSQEPLGPGPVGPVQGPAHQGRVPHLGDGPSGGGLLVVPGRHVRVPLVLEMVLNLRLHRRPDPLPAYVTAHLPAVVPQPLRRPHS